MGVTCVMCDRSGKGSIAGDLLHAGKPDDALAGSVRGLVELIIPMQLQSVCKTQSFQVISGHLRQIPAFRRFRVIGSRMEDKMHFALLRPGIVGIFLARQPIGDYQILLIQLLATFEENARALGIELTDLPGNFAGERIRRRRRGATRGDQYCQRDEIETRRHDHGE